MLELTIDWVSVGIPLEVPPEIYEVLSDPNSYDEDGHPLVGMVPGEAVIDDLTNLSGCWADYDSRVPSYDNPSAADGQLLEDVTIMVLDTARQTYTEYIYVSSMPEFRIDEPVLIVLTGTCTVVNERRILIEITGVKSGVVQDDGSIEANVWTMVDWSMIVGEQFEEFAILDSDHLKIRSADGAYEDADESSEFYTRIDCDGD